MKIFRRLCLFVFLVALTAGNIYLNGEEKMSPQQPTVLLTTNYGDITIELDEAKAPNTVKNFLEYVDEGHYDHTIFHRVIDGFMIQGGGFTADMKQKATKAPIRNEAENGLKNNKFTIAMARTADPHSATAQFFINTSDNAFLNFQSMTPQGFGYCVFGKVVQGGDVIEKIAKVKTGEKSGHRDVPLEPVEIVKAVRITSQA